MRWGFICRDLQGRGVSGLPLGRPHQSVIKCLGSVGELQQRPAYQGGIYLLTVQISSHQIGLLFSPITGWRAEVTDHSIAYLTINRTWKKGVCCTQLIVGDSDGHQVDGKLLLIISTLLFSSVSKRRHLPRKLSSFTLESHRIRGLKPESCIQSKWPGGCWRFSFPLTHVGLRRQLTEFGGNFSYSICQHPSDWLFNTVFVCLQFGLQ